MLSTKPILLSSALNFFWEHFDNSKNFPRLRRIWLLLQIIAALGRVCYQTRSASTATALWRFLNDVNIWFLHTSFVNGVFISLWLVGIQIIYDWNVTMFVIGNSTSQTSAAWAILITDEYRIQALAGIMQQQLLGWQPQHNHYHADLECLEILGVCFLLLNFCCTQCWDQ